MAVAADGTVQPYLAQSLTPNAAFDVWTMKLRPGIKFNDGSPLTSAVVLANYQELKTSPLTGIVFARVKSVTAPDAMTVVYTLDDSYPAFPSAFTTQIGYPFGLAMIDQVKSGTQRDDHSGGHGPVHLLLLATNDHFTATRNPHYWQPQYPYLDQITFRPIPDTTQRESTLRTGGVDIIFSADPNTIKRFSGSGGTGYVEVDSRTGVIGEPTLGFVMLNCITPPTDDVRLRRAIAMATNQAELITLFNAGYGSVVNGLFLEGIPLLRQFRVSELQPVGGEGTGRRVQGEEGDAHLRPAHRARPPRYQHRRGAAEMWNQVGMNVTVSQTEQATIIDDFVLGKFQAVTSYQFGAVDPSLNYVWFSTTTISPIGKLGLNFPRNNDPQLEQAISTGRSTLDAATRVAAYQESDKAIEPGRALRLARAVSSSSTWLRTECKTSPV